MAKQEALSSSQHSLLVRACSATAEPTPGYVYKDIIDMVVRNPNTLSYVESFLLKRLESNEPYVKFKCLKLLKNLCARLPHEFDRNRVCQSQAVADARNYKAPYSEYDGDYLCHMVRNEVEDLLKVVYAQQVPDLGSNNLRGSDQNTMVGFGNMPSSQGIGSMGGVASPNQMNYYGQGQPATGFGNMPTSQTASSTSGITSWFTGRSSAAPAQGNYNTGNMYGFGNTQPRSQSKQSVGGSALKLISDVATKYLPDSVVSKIERVGSSFVSTASDKFGKHVSPVVDMRKKPERFGYSDNFPTANRQSPRMDPGSQSIPAERTLLPSLIQSPDNRINSSEDLSGESEARLVKDMLTFSGIKVTPSQQIIDDFLTRLKDMNMRYVVYELITCLNNRSNTWQTQLRVLCFFEVLMTSANMTEDVRSYANAELEPILIKCREESRLKNKADRLMQLIGEPQRTHRSEGELISTLGSNEQYEKQNSKQSQLDMDLFASTAPAKNEEKRHEPLRNIPSDFTNSNFDLMDSFSPVSSIRTPQQSMINPAAKSKPADDIFDFDQLTINPAKSNTTITEQDIYAALDKVTFQPQAHS
ncbi:hypothetical protein BBOV_III010660 [Babesia bovis T2Bo]|uniref:ENTH domain-containing protein n=1 Tax=Babesia bovis TaxID=5865 RepID=A7APY4_BABBO|nr:hypothetical protein BBOV_III010660 [Babesia bovis T2Bo]EDO08618.1 hypothetical protein BBOV_III010660 [Babesia bovis T2Bo]|eukprot:XP_001612186.1 hypothetical protein [Babesia bovis T2Bo]